MPRLILINGLPGSGKSTLARRYAADHPLSLCLDIDDVRGLLGSWKDESAAAYVLARKLALAMAQVVLVAGRDVVVPQFLGRPEFVSELERLATDTDACFIEIALIATSATASARLAARGAGPMTASQRDSHEMLDRAGGLDTVSEMHRRLGEVCTLRPATHFVSPVPDEIEQTYRSLVRCLPGETA